MREDIFDINLSKIELFDLLNDVVEDVIIIKKKIKNSII